MDTSNQFTASKTATSLNPASIETDQHITGLNIRGFAAGRPVETVSPQASVKTDTPVQEMTGTTTAQDISHIIIPEAFLSLPTMPQATTGNRSSAHSATGGEPLMSIPASINDTEQAECELSDLLMNFYRDPSEAKFRQFEKLTDLNFDHLDPGEGCLKHKLPFAIALISEKNNWPILSSKCGELASEILEGSSERAKWINRNVVTPEKLDFWWSGFYATGEEKYLEKILKVIGPTTSRMKDSIKVTKAVAEWSLQSHCQVHQAVQDFARRMRDDSSLSDYQREFLRSITEREYLRSITDLLPRCNII